MAPSDLDSRRTAWSLSSIVFWGLLSGALGATLLLLHVAVLASQELTALPSPLLFAVALVAAHAAVGLAVLALVAPLARRVPGSRRALVAPHRVASLVSFLPMSLSWAAFGLMPGRADVELAVVLSLAAVATYFAGGELLALVARARTVWLVVALAAIVGWCLYRGPRLPPLPEATRVAAPDPAGAAPEDLAVEPPAASGRPRAVVLLTVDTLRADRLGAYGYSRPTSPNIDRLADQGLRVERMIAASSGTVPSMATLLSGLLPSCHGARSQQGRLDRDLLSVAEIFQRAGYRTLGMAANRLLTEGRGFDQGFEVFTNTGDVPAGRLASGLAEFLAEEPGGEELFAWIHFMDPHTPYRPAGEHAQRFAGDDSYASTVLPVVDYGSFGGVKLSRALGTDSSPGRRIELGRLEALYDAEIRTVDDAVGEIVDSLASHFPPAETVIVLAADHGETLVRSRRDPYFQHALDVYESTVHVPAILWAPGRVPPGSTVTAWSHQADLVPTILELAGLAMPAGDPALEGRSLLQRGASEDPLVSQTAWWDALSLRMLRVGQRRPTYAVYREGYKLISRPHHELSRIRGPLSFVHAWRSIIAGFWRNDELYDLASDPAESSDLSRSAPDLRARLRASLIERLQRPQPDGCPGELAEGAPALDAELDDLRALGYLD